MKAVRMPSTQAGELFRSSLETIAIVDFIACSECHVEALSHRRWQLLFIIIFPSSIKLFQQLFCSNSQLATPANQPTDDDNVVTQ